MLKLFIIIATVFCWCEFVLQDPDAEVHLCVGPACVCALALQEFKA